MGTWLQSGTKNAVAFRQVFAELKGTAEGAGGGRAVHGTILASTTAMVGAPLADGAQAKPTKRIASAIQRGIGKALAVQLLQLTAAQPDIPESVAVMNVDKESAMLLTVAGPAAASGGGGLDGISFSAPPQGEVYQFLAINISSGEVVWVNWHRS